MKKSQLDHYIENQKELVRDHNGEIIVVKDGNFVGSFSCRIDAIRKMEERGIKNGEYLVIKCTPGDTEYTAFFSKWHVNSSDLKALT